MNNERFRRIIKDVRLRRRLYELGFHEHFGPTGPTGSTGVSDVVNIVGGVIRATGFDTFTSSILLPTSSTCFTIDNTGVLTINEASYYEVSFSIQGSTVGLVASPGCIIYLQNATSKTNIII